MTTTPQEPVGDPALTPSGEPDEAPLDPVAPGQPTDPETGNPD
ncbi:MAG TPA: hypothetical protein VHW64_07250 [Nocardioides sp.]|jgi:hypothetical protein|nr:hypothetical protein [Nocardioides sp.]HEX3930481.1 hypothetical protein [Nocardioides sp.]